MPSRRLETMEKNLNEKFRAVIDDNTALSLYYNAKADRKFFIIRKRLGKNYEINVEPSEAPILNRFDQEGEPFEHSLIDVKILEQEIYPIDDNIQLIFGENKALKLSAIRLGVGSSNNDYITIDDEDLIRKGMKPTANGLREFLINHKDSVLGILDRVFIQEEGNVIYLDFNAVEISENIPSIQVLILASMQQRPFFLQQDQQFYGIQLYTIIQTKTDEDEQLREFLQTLDVDYDLVLFKRELAISNWMEIECYQNSDNIKAFLRDKYDTLNYFDCNNILTLAVENELDFATTDRIAEQLSNLKIQRYDSSVERSYEVSLKKAEIIASAKLAIAYIHNGKKDITLAFDNSISEEEILRYEQELISI